MTRRNIVQNIKIGIETKEYTKKLKGNIQNSV
jgi:hypothetical protein